MENPQKKICSEKLNGATLEDNIKMEFKEIV